MPGPKGLERQPIFRGLKPPSPPKCLVAAVVVSRAFELWISLLFGPHISFYINVYNKCNLMAMGRIN